MYIIKCSLLLHIISHFLFPFRFLCNCEHVYHRSLCELDMNECEIAPCVKGENYVNRTDGYNCLCVPGYTGKPLSPLSISKCCCLYINGNFISYFLKPEITCKIQVGEKGQGDFFVSCKRK